MSEIYKLLNHYNYLPKVIHDKLEIEIPINELREIYLDKLKRNEYITKQKNDKDIVSYISFITNNLPSFNKYKNENNLSYIFKNNNKIILETLIYHIGQELSIISFYKRINSLIRLLYIGTEGEKTEFIKKYLNILNEIAKEINKNNEEQKLNKYEKKTFFDFQIFIDKRELYKELYKDSLTYNLNQDLLLLSLYSLIPPNRNEISELIIITDITNDDKVNDFILINNDEIKIIFNKEKKKHKGISIDITGELEDIIRESYDRYPRPYLITNYYDRNKLISYDGIYKRFREIFNDNRISINAIRSSYLSYLNKKGMSISDKKKIAIQMRTGVRTIDMNYIKIIK